MKSSIKLYVEYARKDPAGERQRRWRLSTDSTRPWPTNRREWLSKVNDITMVVDLGPFARLIMIRGQVRCGEGRFAAFIDPGLDFASQR